ncbi:Nascent polypeptide-associated complex subunit beta [Aspergillus flavus]|nr:Nascent polypeptide-associated complex subunit beta [Aspergillus flavus]
MLANLYLHVEQGTYKFSFLFAQSPSGTAFDHENGKLTHTYPQCIISPSSSHTRSTPNSYKPDHESTRLTNSLKNRGKGTPRRKVKKVHKSSGADDKKLQATLKKMNVQPIQAIEEVNMFKEDGNVIHFGAPKVHASVPSNTFALYGNGEEKELTELVPGILNQLGPDSLASLRKLAESYQNMQKNQAGAEGKKDDEDDIPDLVEGENFESNVE